MPSSGLKSIRQQASCFVTPNEPVIITSYDLEFTGAGAEQPQFQVISILPEQQDGDIFNHGDYERPRTGLLLQPIIMVILIHTGVCMMSGLHCHRIRQM